MYVFMILFRGIYDYKLKQTHPNSIDVVVSCGFNWYSGFKAIMNKTWKVLCSV